MMTKHTVTTTLASPAEFSRGMQISMSRGTTMSDGQHVYWIVGRKSARELIVASTWRDSLWVLWFQFAAWATRKWRALRSCFEARSTREEEGVLVSPTDSADDEDDG